MLISAAGAFCPGSPLQQLPSQVTKGEFNQGAGMQLLPWPCSSLPPAAQHGKQPFSSPQPLLDGLASLPGPRRRVSPWGCSAVNPAGSLHHYFPLSSIPPTRPNNPLGSCRHPKNTVYVFFLHLFVLKWTYFRKLPKLRAAICTFGVTGVRWGYCLLGGSWRKQETIVYSLPNGFLPSPCIQVPSRSALNDAINICHVRFSLCCRLSRGKEPHVQQKGLFWWVYLLFFHRGKCISMRQAPFADWLESSSGQGWHLAAKPLLFGGMEQVKSWVWGERGSWGRCRGWKSPQQWH